MGQEVACRMRYRERTLAGQAYLETDHVLFRGEERLKVVFRDLQSVRAESGVLYLEFNGGPAELELGAAAEKWMRKILNPPSRLQKLGVKPGLSIRLVGEFDREFRADLSQCQLQEADQADLIFLAAGKTSTLSQLRKLVPRLKPNGALWVVYPKGVTAIREIEVIEAGRAAGLKDVKVASFSLTHTALKFMIPVARRSAG